jgi:anti-sigma factor RsiW
MNETVEELSCQELVELVTDYLEGALGPEERNRFEQHLAECGSCRAYLEQMRETIRAVGRLEPDALTPEAEQALRQTFRSWRSP